MSHQSDLIESDILEYLREHADDEVESEHSPGAEGVGVAEAAGDDCE